MMAKQIEGVSERILACAEKEFLHIVTTSYFDGVFEIVRHRMEKETAKCYIKMLEAYHMTGFETIFSR